MNRIWMALVGVGVLILVAVVGWEVFLVLSGSKSEFNYNLVPIGSALFGKTELHLRSDPEFIQFQGSQAPEGESSEQ